MYAIIEIAGQQFKVEKDQKIFINRLEQKEGTQIDIDSVLLLDNDKNVLVGEPTINGARIVARVLSHLKGDKIKIFKKKKRKGYQVLNGHRQQFTQIRIEEIIEKISDKGTLAAEPKKKTAAAPEGEQTGKAFKKEAATTTKGKAQTGITPARKVSPKKAPATADKEEKPAVKKAASKKPAPAAEKPTTGKVKKSGVKTAAKQKTGEKKAVAKKPETKSTKKK